MMPATTNIMPPLPAHGVLGDKTLKTFQALAHSCLSYLKNEAEGLE